MVFYDIDIIYCGMHDFFYKRYLCSIYCIYVCKSKCHKFSLLNVLLQKKYLLQNIVIGLVYMVTLLRWKSQR